jgi:hypothetical protein
MASSRDYHPTTPRGHDKRGAAAVTIEILYFDGCPNHEQLLEHLPRLLAREGIHAEITPHRVRDAQSAQRERFLGSPTIRVGGRDIDPGAADRTDFGRKCRIYQTPEGLTGVPPDEWILAALGPNQENLP